MDWRRLHWGYLAMFLVFTAAVWKADGVLGVLAGLFLSAIFICLAKRNERKSRREQNG